MAIGLDTSVVVRLLVGLPQAQARAARRRLERATEEAEAVLVSDLVVAEAYHALQHHYGVPKAEARSLLLQFVQSGVVRLEPRASIPALAAPGGPGVVDRLIHLRYRALGAATLTFEHSQARLEGAVRLRP